MHVNSDKYPGFKLFAVIFMISLCVVLLLSAFVIDRPETTSKRVQIALRAIGHNLLLHAGDSNSVLPPVTEKSNGVFVLEFENEFAFQPETLVAIAQRFLTQADLSQYTVTVQQCNDSRIVYGFEVNSPNDSVIPCRGRLQPKACYNIEVAFAEFPGAGFSYPSTTLIIGAILSALAVVLIGKNVVIRKPEPPPTVGLSVQNESITGLPIGRFVFDTVHRTLKLGEETISLTDKECRVLTMLNANPGRLTSREDLIEGVWTNEGVITGRSLDMFISKLRKKLSGDAHLRITNVHGKGYKLEVLEKPNTISDTQS